MELTTPDPVPIEILEFDFLLAGGKGVDVTVFPSKGDTWEETTDRYVFRWPRFDRTQTLFKLHVVGVEEQRGMRVFLDHAELMKRLHEQKNKKADDADKPNQ